MKLPELDMTMSHLPLMGSPWPLFLIIGGYLLFVLKVGPAVMRHREPFQLRSVLLIYNLLQVVINFALAIYIVNLIVVYRPYDIGCALPIPPDNALHHKEVILFYAYYIIKVIDLLDTIFFVLRKNFKQVTVLHVYHHAMMTLSVYFLCRLTRCGGHSAFLGALNLFVHGVMYSYYFLAARYPRISRTLPWKKYITLLQMTQFVVLILHNLWPLVMRSDCQFPKAVNFVLLLQSSIMFGLFASFYKKAYLRKSKIKEQ